MERQDPIRILYEFYMNLILYRRRQHDNLQNHNNFDT